MEDQCDCSYVPKTYDCDDCDYYRPEHNQLHPHGCSHVLYGTFESFSKKPIRSCTYKLYKEVCEQHENIIMNSYRIYPSEVNVNTPTNPKHYNQFNKHEPWDVIEEWGLPFSLGNVVKYIARAGHKESSTLLEDLKKAKTYLDKYIERIEKGEIKR